MNKKILFVYGGLALIIVLAILLAVQLSQKHPTKYVTTYNITPKQHLIVVETPKGFISADSTAISDELMHVHKKLQQLKKLKCKNLVPMIQQAVLELQAFIRNNPISEKEMCTLNIRKDKLEQALHRTITPDALDAESAYKTVLEIEEEHRDLNHNPQALLLYLLNNIEVAAKLLRGDVCEQGKINLTRLYLLLLELNIKVCIYGNNYVRMPPQRYDSCPTPYEHTPLSAYRPHIEPMASSCESMVARNTVPRFDHIEEYAEASNGYVDTEDVAANVYGGDVINRKSDGFSIPVTNTRFDSIKNITNDDKAVQEIATRATHYKAHTYNAQMGGSTLLDLTIEGLAERDIAGYKPIGHSIGTSDKESHMTVLVNGCLGKTPTDDILLSKCVNHDVSRLMALDGDARYMLSDIGALY